MNIDRDMFLGFCSEITGYSGFDLEGTGLVDDYHRLLQDTLGPTLYEQLGVLVREVLAHPTGNGDRRAHIERTVVPSKVFWPVVAELIYMWNLGVWRQLPDAWYAAVGLPRPGPNDAGRTHVPTQLAYTEQLSYRAAFAHPPGTKPTGFGSWAKPPI